MDKKLKILGIIAVSLGAIASILCILPPYGLFLSLPTGFFGMITSTIYVYIDTKHQINTKKLTPGIIGIFLSSIPIILILVILIMSRFK